MPDSLLQSGRSSEAEVSGLAQAELFPTPARRIADVAKLQKISVGQLLG